MPDGKEEEICELLRKGASKASVATFYGTCHSHERFKAQLTEDCLEFQGP